MRKEALLAFCYFFMPCLPFFSQCTPFDKDFFGISLVKDCQDLKILNLLPSFLFGKFSGLKKINLIFTKTKLRFSKRMQ